MKQIRLLPFPLYCQKSSQGPIRGSCRRDQAGNVCLKTALPNGSTQLRWTMGRKSHEKRRQTRFFPCQSGVWNLESEPDQSGHESLVPKPERPHQNLDPAQPAVMQYNNDGVNCSGVLALASMREQQNSLRESPGSGRTCWV